MAVRDVVIIGGGASGLSAAAAAAELGLSSLVIDRMGGGGELMNLGPLHDLDEGSTGPDLAAQLLENAITAGVDLEIGEVSRLTRQGGEWHVETEVDVYHGRAAILAVGLAPGTLALDREAEFEGRGLSHCAACDGPLYRGSPVVVAGADRWAVQEAKDLAALDCKVTLVTQGGTTPSAVAGIAIVSGRIVTLDGASALESVRVLPAVGTTELRLPAQAVFVQTGRSPGLGFLEKLPACAPDGCLIAKADLQCDELGMFVAGDARAGADRTLAAAIKEGRRAAVAAHAMLAALGKRRD